MIAIASALSTLWKRKEYDFLDFFPKQSQALKILTENNGVSELLYGGAAGGGKSWLGCTWLLFMCLSYPGTKWFIARKELTDIVKSTIVTLNKVCKFHGLDPKSIFSINWKYNIITFSNGSTIDLIKLQEVPSDKDFDSLGSLEYTGGWIEEAAQITFSAFEAIKSRIGRHLNDELGIEKKLLVTCNPSKNWLYREFYIPLKSKILKKYRRFIQSLVTDNPRIDKGYIENLDNMSKAKKQRLRFGNWEYDDDESTLIAYDAIQALFSNSHVGRYTGGKYITADIALQGSDRFVIGVWEGFSLIDIKIIDKISSKEAEKLIREMAYSHGVPEYRICFDGDGLGSYLQGYLELAKSFHNGGSPVDSNIEGSDFVQMKEDYRNLKSQCYFRLARVIQDGKMWVKCDLPGESKDQLIEELEAIKDRSYGTDDKLEVLRKKEVKELIGRSPDITDMMMMRMYFTLHNELCHQSDIYYYVNNFAA